MTAGVELPLRAIREQIASAFDLLVQIRASSTASRRDHAHHRGRSAWSPTCHAAGHLRRAAARTRTRPPRRDVCCHRSRDRPEAALPREARRQQRGLSPHFFGDDETDVPCAFRWPRREQGSAFAPLDADSAARARGISCARRRVRGERCSRFVSWRRHRRLPSSASRRRTPGSAQRRCGRTPSR
jgi:hypothetical protein